MTAQLVVPFRLERIGDEAVVGIDLHVAPARELGFIAQSLDMLAAQGVGLGGAGLELALNRQGDRRGSLASSSRSAEHRSLHRRSCRGPFWQTFPPRRTTFS